MKKSKIKKILPVNPFLFISYCVLAFYAYANTNRRINNLFMLLTILIVMDGIYFFICIRQIEIKLTLDEMTQKSQLFGLNVQVRNKGILPITYMEVVPREGHRAHLEEEKHIVMMLRGRQQISQVIMYRADLCGLEEIGPYNGIYKSPFSFFRKEVFLEEKMKIKILPEIRQIENVQFFTQFIGEYQTEDGQAYKDYLKSHEEEIGYDLKPYVEGDSQRLIHWKIAAYKGELLVRQREHESEKRNDIFFILAPFLSEEYGDEIVQQDKLLTTFVSIVSYYFEKIQKVRVAFFKDKSWHYVKIKNTGQLRAMQESLGSYESLLVEQVANQRSIIRSVIEVAEKKEGIKIIVSGYWTQEIENYILNKGTDNNLPYLWTGDNESKEKLSTSVFPIWHMTDQYQLVPLRDIEVK